jgi:hypothetical protein
MNEVFGQTGAPARARRHYSRHVATRVRFILSAGLTMVAPCLQRQPRLRDHGSKLRPFLPGAGTQVRNRGS